MPVPIAELFVTVGADITGLTSGLTGAGSQLQKFGNSIQSAGRDLTVGLTAPIVGATAAVGLIGADFEHAFTGVRKTVNLTGKDLDDFRQGLVDLSANPEAGGKSAVELAQIAEVAGQLGIDGTAALLDFTKTVAQLSVTTGISTGEISDGLARVAVLTGTFKTGEITNLGSAITALGNDMAGSESDIIAIATRSAGALHQLGATAPDILGLASAASALGQEPEAAGTAISKTFLEIGAAVAGIGSGSPEAAKKVQNLQDKITDLGTSLQTAEARQAQFGRNTPASEVQATAAAIEKYKRELAQANTQLANLQAGSGGDQLKGLADAAGLTTDEFKKLFKTNPVQAFAALVHGLASISETKGPDALLKALDALGITDVRQRQLLLGLVGASDQLDKALGVSNEAFGENTATQIEVQKAMEDTTNQFNLLVNQLKKIAIDAWPAFKAAATDAMKTIRSEVIPRLTEMRKAWEALGPEMQRNILIFAGVAAVLGPVVLIIGVLVTTLGSLLSPLVLAILFVGLLAAAWITNWEGIRDKAGAAIVAVAGFLKNDFGGALKVATVLAVVAGAIIGVVLAQIAAAWAVAAAQMLKSAALIALDWIIAFAPVIGTALLVIGILALIIGAVALFRKAWDTNWGNLRDSVADLFDALARFYDLIANAPIPGLDKSFWQDQAAEARKTMDEIRQKPGDTFSNLQPVADALDIGGRFGNQFKKGFPDFQNSLNQAFSGALANNAGTLEGAGIPGSAINQAVTATQTAAGPQVPSLADLSNISVVINNPAILDEAMLNGMTDQVRQQVFDALVASQQAVDSLPQPGLPGQPF